MGKMEYKRYYSVEIVEEIDFLNVKVMWIQISFGECVIVCLGLFFLLCYKFRSYLIGNEVLERFLSGNLELQCYFIKVLIQGVNMNGGVLRLEVERQEVN